MKESKAVYVTKRDIKVELNREYQFYTNKITRDREYSPESIRHDQKTHEVGCQYDCKRDNLICICRNLATLRKRQEVRYFGLPSQIYAYHRSRSFTDIGVGSVKALQRKKVKKIYLPETDNRGVGSSDLSSFFLQNTRQHRGNSYYENKRTSSKCVGGILEYNTGCVMNEKLSPIVQNISRSTSPREFTLNRNIEIGSSTVAKNLTNTTTQVEDTTKKDIEIKSEVKVAEIIKPIIIIQGNTKEMKTKTVDSHKPTESKHKPAEKVYSSDSLVQHVHNLENPSDEKESHLSVETEDPMENKLEREYRKIFAAKSKSRDSKSTSDRPIPDFKSTSTLKKRFEALRRGLVKKEDSKKNAVIVNQVSSQISAPSRKDVSINSDPPSLEGRSFSNTKTYSPFPPTYRDSGDKTIFNPITSHYRRSIYGKKERGSAQWSSRPDDDDSECQGVKGMFKLWGKKFNLEEDQYKRRYTPRPSYNSSKKGTTKKIEEFKVHIKPEVEEKKGRKFFFFKKKTKENKEKPYKAKKGVTAGRCEVRDGLMIKIGGNALVPEDIVTEPEIVPEDYEEMVRNAWLKNFLTHSIESRNSVQVRWNNKSYAPSSSTVFELMDNVYKDAGVIIRSKSQLTVSSYKPHTKHCVNFAHQNIEAWMIPKTLTDTPKLLAVQLKCKSDEEENDMEVRISDQKWFIDKSKAFSHKIELVLHSKNVSKLNKKKSSEYLRIDIPQGFFVDSSSDDNNNHPTNQYSDEEVYKIIEYETGSDLKKEKALRNFDKQNNIKVTVSVKESKDGVSKVREAVKSRDVVIQGSNVYIPKRCDVIGVGIITQRDRREIRKPILKIQDDFSDEESEHNILKSNQKKCEFAESYLQDYYRHFTPLGIDLFSWFVSDSHLRCCSETSRTSLNNQGDGTKSCPNIFDDFQASTIVSSCGASSCSQCHSHDDNEKSAEKSSWFGKLKKKCKDTAHKKDATRKLLPKDSIEVFKRRKIYAASMKSKWTVPCPDFDQPSSVPSIESKGAQNTLTECPKLMKSCYKPIEPRPRRRTCKKHVSLPDCDAMNELLAKQLADAVPEGILAFKGGTGCEICKRKGSCPKHAKVNPKPSCEIPRAPCRDSCEQMKKPPCADSKVSCDKPPECPGSPTPRPCKTLSCPATPPPCKTPSCPATPPPCRKPPSCPPTPCKKPLSYPATPPSCSPSPPPCKKTSPPPPCKKPPSCPPTPPPSYKTKPSCPPTPSRCQKKPPCPPSPPPCRKSPPYPHSPPPYRKPPSCPPNPPTCRKPLPCPPSPPCKKPPPCPASPPPCRRPPTRSPTCPLSPPPCKNPHCPSPQSCPHIPVVMCPPSPPPCPRTQLPCPKSPPPCPKSPAPCPKSQPPCPKPPSQCPKSPTSCPHAPSCPPSPPPCYHPPPRQRPPSCPHSPPCIPPPPPCYPSSKPCPMPPPSCPTTPPSCCSADPNRCPAHPPPCEKALTNLSKKLSPFFKRKTQMCPASPPCKPTPCKPSYCKTLACQPSPCEIKRPCVPSPCQMFSATSCSYGSLHPTPDAPYFYSPIHPCPPEYEQPKKKAEPCNSPPCNTRRSTYKPPSFECKDPDPLKPYVDPRTCDQCRTSTTDFPWPTKNQVSNQSSVTSLYQATTKEEPLEFGECKKDCPMMPKLSCETIPSPKKECKQSCPNKQGSPRPPCMPQMQCPPPKPLTPPAEPIKAPTPETVKCKSKPKMSGLFLKMKPVSSKKKTTCSKDCLAWDSTQREDGCISLNSEKKITIRLKRETPSTAEIREGLNIKVQDEDGMTLFERKDYRLQHASCSIQRPSLLGDMYKASEVRRVTTKNSAQAIGTDQDCRKEITEVKSDASIANLIDIQFKLKVTQGDKTTEINIANNGDKKNELEEKIEHNKPINKMPQEVFVVKDEGERLADHSDQKNDINIRIVIKNFKSKSGKKKSVDVKHDDYSKEFSKKISAKFHTVSTGYSDVLHDDNVFSVHRATVDLTSSVDKSKTHSNRSEEIRSEPLIELGRGISMGSCEPSICRCITTDMSEGKGEDTEVKSVSSQKYSATKEIQENLEETDTEKLTDHKYEYNEETDTDKPIKYDTEETDTDKQVELKYDTEETDTEKQAEPKYDTFMSTDTDEPNTLPKIKKSKSIEVIVKPHTRDEKKEMLKQVFEKAHETKTKNKNRMKKLRDMLKVILTSDSSDHEDTKLLTSELAKDVTFASLKPNYFRDSDSMNNYYRAESNAVLTEEEINRQVVHPSIENNSECSNSNQSDVLSSENDAPKTGGCMCSTVAARLKLASRIGEGGGCCCAAKANMKKNEETTCDLKRESDYFQFDYKTEFVDVQTQNSIYLTSKINSTNLSSHKSLRNSFVGSINVQDEIKSDSGVINVDDRHFSLRKSFAPHMNHVRECETRKLNRNTILSISDEDKIVLRSGNSTRLPTYKGKNKKKKLKDSVTMLPASDILQSYETKKAVLEIYTEKTVSDEGERLVAKLPKFVYDREHEIQMNYEAMATNTYKTVCKKNIVMMAINR